MLTLSGHLGFFPADLLHSSYDCTLCYPSPLHFPSQDLAEFLHYSREFFPASGKSSWLALLHHKYL